MSVSITGACNLNCAFCYVGGPRKGKMEFSVFKKIVEDAMKLGVETVKLTGGEPLLHEEWEKFAQYLEDCDLNHEIITNGTMITEEVAKKLKATKTGVRMSLESIEEKIDDSLTCIPGAWKKRMLAIENLKKAGFTKKELYILTKALKQNKKTFLQTYDWAIKNNITPTLGRLIPVMNAKEDWALKGEEFRELLAKANQLFEFNEAVQLPQLKNSPCNIQGKNCYVEVNGDVFPCSGLRVIAGNIFQQSLTEIWNNSKVFKEFCGLRDNLKGSCAKCQQNKEKKCCGCRAIAFATFHDPCAPDPHCPNYNPKDKWQSDYSYWKKQNFENIPKTKNK
jgi:MoaA/NifB/PqqE/SkfB family radical SAM enzyme